jgi:hypothetical protein
MNVFTALSLIKTAERRHYRREDRAMPFETQSAQQRGNDIPVVPDNYLPAAIAALGTAAALKRYEILRSIGDLQLHRREGADGPVSTALALGGGVYVGHKVREYLNDREEQRRARER